MLVGCFEFVLGWNLFGNDVVWVDYDVVVFMYCVCFINFKECWLECLVMLMVVDNRISWGCINVLVVFFDWIVWFNLGYGCVVVYVLFE